MGKYSKSDIFMQPCSFLTNSISNENPTSVGMDERTAENSILTSTLDTHWVIKSRFFLKQSNKLAPRVRKLHLFQCSLSFLIILLQILHHSVSFGLLSVEQISKRWNTHEFTSWLMFCLSRFSVTLHPPLVMPHKHILGAPLSSSHSLMFAFCMHVAGLLDTSTQTWIHQVVSLVSVILGLSSMCEAAPLWSMAMCTTRPSNATPAPAAWTSRTLFLVLKLVPWVTY